MGVYSWIACALSHSQFYVGGRNIVQSKKLILHDFIYYLAKLQGTLANRN